MSQKHRTSVIRPGKPIVRVTFQATWLLGDRSNNALLPSAVDACLKWVAEKHHEPLPSAALELKSFELDDHGTAIAGTMVGTQWALRMRQPDTPYFEHRAAVAGRTWTTDLAVWVEKNETYFSARVICSSQEYANEPIVLTRPRVVLDVADAVGLRDLANVSLDGTLSVINRPSQLVPFVRFLEDGKRRFPIVVLTERSGGQSGSIAAMDAERLAGRLKGLAHVYLLPGDLSYHLTDILGTEWSVFGGAIRSYMPGLDTSAQHSSEHPYVRFDKVQTWRWRDEIGPIAFAKFLSEEAIKGSTAGANTSSSPQYYVALQSRASASVAESATAGLDDFRSRIRALEAEVSENDALLQFASDSEKAAREEVARVVAENFQLRRSNESLRLALRESGRAQSQTATRPTDYKDVEAWVSENFPGRVSLHNRAMRSLKDAEYEDIEVVLDALSMLANEYRDMKLGYEGARETFEERCGELGLECSPSITDARAGEQGNLYEIGYPVGTDQKRRLEMHLKKGSSKDQRHCLRIYFFYDEEKDEIVVGHLPSHLRTRAS